MWPDLTDVVVVKETQRSSGVLVDTAEIKQGDGESGYFLSDTPAGFSTLQSKQSTAAQQILASFQGNRQRTKLCPFKPFRENSQKPSLMSLSPPLLRCFWKGGKKPSFPKDSL